MSLRSNDLIEQLIEQFSRLPGLGPRSARRAVIYLLEKRPEALAPLAQSLNNLVGNVHRCLICGNISTALECQICTDEKRDQEQICVVETVSDLWAIERAGFYRGQYHVLGGTLSAFDGIGPENLRIPYLVERARKNETSEVILALSATIDGQTTANYLADALRVLPLVISGLAKGVPLGSELDYLDEGTIETAFMARR